MILLMAAVFSVTAASGDEAYLAELIRRSAETNLADAREWHLLLHYRANVLGSDYTSEVDDPHFFLAPQGKTDPQAELAATLGAFFSTAKVGQSEQPAQCAFIARYHWLTAALAIDDQRLSPQSCEPFEQWFQELNPESMTLIFPSAYMHNPASLFGHSLLRIDQKGQTEHTRLLAYTINYAAHDTSRNRLGYVVSGISGGFHGDFSIKPYYELVKEYGDFENRDIWEYQLNLTAGQIRLILMHLWELKNGYFDYFFFKENCAYHIFALLEVAIPELHFTDAFRAWTVPADTVRLLASYPGLVRSVTYRPAPSTQIRSKLASLTTEERHALDMVIENPTGATSTVLTNLPLEQQALILDLAIDYLQYRRITRKQRTASTPEDPLYHLFVLRSRLAAQSQPVAIEPFVTQPDLGHDSLRVGFGTGWRHRDWFEEFTARAGYHDLLDPGPGYTPDSQIEILAFRVRHYHEGNRIRLDQFTLADMISLSPLDALLPAPSWKLRVGIDTVNRKSCHYCHNLNLNGGLGVAAETHWLRREVYFFFPELDMNVSHAFADHHRIGAGGTVGMLASLTDRWKIMASGTYLRYPLGESADELEAFCGQSYALRRNWVLRWEFHHRQHDNEAVLRLQAYF